MTVLSDLLAYQRRTQTLAQTMMRLGWDQETVMPKGAAAQRADEMAALESVLHARRAAPEVGDMLAAAEPQSEEDRAHLREIQRRYDRTRKVPADLAAEITRITSLAHGIWAQARADEDVAAFLPMLKQIVALRRQEAQAVAADGALYDALLQDYEPGMTEAEIATLFDQMRPRLINLRARIADLAPMPQIRGHFPHHVQLALGEHIARAFGYDFDRGRIDLAVHPFSSGSGTDVRITTRVDEADPLGCLYSTIHEVGHAGYEQNITADYMLTILGEGASMGVHESQSRIYENQLGRSPAFTRWLFTVMRDRFGEIGLDNPATFTRAVNAVQPGFIRTEADEIHYNLHIMLRFDLERALISGNLPVTEVEAAWNDRFQSDFGMAINRPSNGMLQDVHWAAGLFGYFPTYTLGNVYAGCLYKALRADVPSLDDRLAQGDPLPAIEWLTKRVHRFGGLRPPQDTIVNATGAAISAAPLLDYLDEKYAAIHEF